MLSCAVRNATAELSSRSFAYGEWKSRISDTTRSSPKTAWLPPQKTWPYTRVWSALYDEQSANITKAFIASLHNSNQTYTIEYALPLWHHTLTKSQAQPLEAVQRRAIKIILSFFASYAFWQWLAFHPSEQVSYRSLQTFFSEKILPTR